MQWGGFMHRISHCVHRWYANEIQFLLKWNNISICYFKKIEYDIPKWILWSDNQNQVHPTLGPVVTYGFTYLVKSVSSDSKIRQHDSCTSMTRSGSITQKTEHVITRPNWNTNNEHWSTILLLTCHSWFSANCAVNIKLTSTQYGVKICGPLGMWAYLLTSDSWSSQVYAVLQIYRLALSRVHRPHLQPLHCQIKVVFTNGQVILSHCTILWQGQN